MEESTRISGNDDVVVGHPHVFSERARDVVLFTRVALDRVFDGANRFTWETERLQPDGTSVSSAVTARPYVVDGEVVGIVEDFGEFSDGTLPRDVAQRLATHDVLTGLPNRLLFADRLLVAIAQAERGGLTPAVLFCDIDHFKAVNDTHGHAVGDAVLRFAATTLRKAVRRADTVARFGGDEIVVLLPDVPTPSHATMVARKMLERVRVPQTYGDVVLAVTMSVGVSLLRPAEDADSLVKRADEAMYRAKQLGGDGYQAAVD